MSTPERQPLPEAQPAPVAVQAEALTIYLEALFAEKPASLPVPVVPVMPRVIDVEVLRVETPVAAPVMAPPVAEVAAPVVTVVETPAPAVAPPKVETPVATPRMEVATATATETGELPRPDWAEAPFPCLLLRMAGLTLALPLVKLNRILPWTELTPIPCYASWLLGVMQVDGIKRQVKVVDTLGFVTPERKPAEPKTPQHIVMIGEGEWALTCEDVSSIITIDPNKVRWRTSRTKRPWLAGTVIEHLCALLDVEELAKLLTTGAGDLPA
jgi:purine-binding chemotaxis protein CheW